MNTKMTELNEYTAEIMGSMRVTLPMLHAFGLFVADIVGRAIRPSLPALLPQLHCIAMRLCRLEWQRVVQALATQPWCLWLHNIVVAAR